MKQMEKKIKKHKGYRKNVQTLENVDIQVLTSTVAVTIARFLYIFTCFLYNKS